MNEQSKTVSTDSLMHETRTFPPAPEVVKRAYINAEQYKMMYERSIRDADTFWLEQANTLEWIKKPTMAREYTWDTPARRVEHTWFKDGQLNISVNCLDRHLQTPNRTRPAIVWLPRRSATSPIWLRSMGFLRACQTSTRSSAPQLPHRMWRA